MKNKIIKKIDHLNEMRNIKGFNVPEEILVLNEICLSEKQLLTLYYFQEELPPDVFRESIYGRFLQNRKSLMNGLYLTEEKLDKAISNLVYHHLIDDSKYQGRIRSFFIDMEELQKRYKYNRKFPADILVKFRSRNLFSRIILLLNTSWRILTAK